mmetsp:Transcript_37509/g.72227  ORF Transcript_37509/g.72227 Transcript_37509/m.72227 type:complete len:231 (-) Transcript_37509:538-1230(-)
MALSFGIPFFSALIIALAPNFFLLARPLCTFFLLGPLPVVSVVASLLSFSSSGQLLQKLSTNDWKVPRNSLELLGKGTFLSIALLKNSDALWKLLRARFLSNNIEFNRFFVDAKNGFMTWENLSAFFMSSRPFSVAFAMVSEFFTLARNWESIVLTLVSNSFHSGKEFDMRMLAISFSNIDLSVGSLSLQVSAMNWIKVVLPSLPLVSFNFFRRSSWNPSAWPRFWPPFM